MLYSDKSIEAALSLAEKETGKNRNEFIYRVTEKKNGLFKDKLFQVEITGFKKRGKIRVSMGKVLYDEGDMLPTIAPGEGVDIYVNNSLITSQTQIKFEDEVLIQPKNLQMDRKMDIDVSEDNMQAYITIQYIPEAQYEICDTEENSDLIVNGKRLSEKIPQKFTKNDIQNFLTQNKIWYGIKWENTEKILAGGRYLIAEGTKPAEPVDDKIKYYFNSTDDKKPVEVNGKVDYYSIGNIETVEKGSVLAIREVGSDGKAGRDIFGRVINPIKRKILKLGKGPGCDLLDNGCKAVAIIKGLPSFKGGTVCVFPVHRVQGDIDLKTGNIGFDGDVVVTGNVKEGHKIKAGNNITVFGDVAEADITAGGNIIIYKNLISSNVKAGDKQINDTTAFEYLKIYDDLFTKMISYFIELKQSGKMNPNIKDEIVFKIMLESKLKLHKDKILEGINFISKNKIKSEISDIWTDCFDVYKMIEEGILSDANSIYSIKKALSEFITRFEIINTPADVSLNYCQNSTISATNSIEIKGKGCYSSTIYAENSVVFTGNPGVIRGGQIYGGIKVTAREVGSEAGVLTVLKTSKNGIIEAKTVYQNTILYVGEQIYKIEQPSKMLKAYINKGEIVVEKLKL